MLGWGRLWGRGLGGRGRGGLRLGQELIGEQLDLGEQVAVDDGRRLLRLARHELRVHHQLLLQEL